MGHSYRYCAQSRAAVRTYSLNLTLDPRFYQVHWLDVRGLKWEELLLQIENAMLCLPDPHIVIIHAGSNDVGKIRTLDLSSMNKDLPFLKCKFPWAKFLFLEVVPRLSWERKELRFCKKIRRHLNKSLEKFMSAIDGFYYRHVDLEGLLEVFIERIVFICLK